MRRRVEHHHYDLPRTPRDYQRQMCGRLAVVFFASMVVAILVCGVMLLAKLLATALVLVQP